MSSISMSEVANMAGVSTATVSHVINNTRFVSEKTRQRVQDCIDKLGYRPNLAARSFKTGKKYLIGFIVPDIANAFFATIIEAVENVIGEHGYRLIVSNTKETPEREIENLRILSNGIVDGLIIASTLNSYKEMGGIIPDGLPVVFIDRALKNCPFESIVVTNYDAVYQAVANLISDGHKRIGYITGLTHLSTTQERLTAYRDAMTAHGLIVEPKFICVGTSMHNELDLCIDQLLAQSCTAVIVSNNVMTDDVLYYLDQHNLRDKITIVGYNDTGYHNYALRGICFIHQPSVLLGRTAGQQILEQIQTPGRAPKQISLNALFKKP